MLHRRLSSAVRWKWPALLSLLMALPTWAEWPPLIPREVLLGNPEKASPQVSPDGTRIAYLAPHEGVLNVWVRTLGKSDDRVVTSDKKRGIRFFTWQPDGRHILYIQDRDGDENWHLYQTHIETRTTRDLTPFTTPAGVQARVVAVDPNFPDEILVALNIRDPRLHDVYRVDLRTGAVTLDTPNPGDVFQWYADHRLRVRAAQAFRPDGGSEVRIREDDRSPWRTLLRWGPEETFGGVVGFTPDGRGVYVITSVGANAARLVRVDVASGKTAVLAEDPQFDVTGALIHPTRRHVEAVLFLRERAEWTVIDEAVRQDFAALQRVWDGDLTILSRDRQDRYWTVAYEVDNGPVRYYLYDRQNRQATPLFTNRPELEKYTLARMRPIRFRARDGMTLYGYLTLPVGVEPRNLPTVVLVHGGPWARDVWGYDPVVQWLANRGYAVLQVNFRGSSGYGKAYLNAGDREWAGRMHTDVLDGKDWLVAQGIADPRRVCIMGGSYGGYEVLVALTFTPDEFTCGVDIVGPSNLITLLQSIPPYWAPLKAVLDRRLGKLPEDEAFLRERSPLFQADRIRAPLLIGHGANDPRVKLAESEQIVQALCSKGIPVTLIVYPDEGHGLVRPENRLDFYGRVEEFLAVHLGGRREPWKAVAGSTAVERGCR